MLYNAMGTCVQDLKAIWIETALMLVDVSRRKADHRALPEPEQNRHAIDLEILDALAQQLTLILAKSLALARKVRDFRVTLAGIHQEPDDLSLYNTSMLNTGWQHLRDRRSVWALFKLAKDKHMFLPIM